MEVRLILIKNRMLKSRDDSFLISKGSENLPGPGVYSNSTIFDPKNKNGFTFGLKLKLNGDNGFPGPGSYSDEKTEVHKHKMPVFSLGKSERSIDLFTDAGGSQFLQNSQGRIRSSSPGPGHYQLDGVYIKTMTRVRSVAVEKSKRGIDFTNENLTTPGPGAYDNDTGKLKNKNPIWSISKQNRNDPLEIQRQKENLPGPGVYNVNTSIGTGQTVNQNINLFQSMFRGKPKYNDDNGVPGPGAYTQKESEIKKSGGWK